MRRNQAGAPLAGTPLTEAPQTTAEGKRIGRRSLLTALGAGAIGVVIGAGAMGIANLGRCSGTESETGGQATVDVEALESELANIIATTSGKVSLYVKTLEKAGLGATSDNGTESSSGVTSGGEAAATSSQAETPAVEIAFDAEAQCVSASVIKLLVLARLLHSVNDGAVSLDQYLFVSDSPVSGAGMVQYMSPGSGLTVLECARFMIAYSDNEATNMLIDLLGMDAINAEATELGLTQTVLGRKMMDFDAQAAGFENYISCLDAARILEAIYDGTLYGETLSAQAFELLQQQTDTSGARQGLPASVAFAHKTGELDMLQNDAGIVLTTSPYVFVALTSGDGNGNLLALLQNLSRATYEAVEGEQA